MNSGNQAYELVQAYSQLGGHRTGSLTDRRTSDWLAAELANLGAEISFQPFDYAKFDFELTVRSAGKKINSMPLYYAFDGRHTVTNPAIGIIDAHGDETTIFANIEQLITTAKSDGCDGLIVATQCPTGVLCAVNSECDNELDFPVILVAQNDLEQIQSHGASIDCCAAIQNDLATNIIAEFQGPKSAGTIVITTPVSGWFQCAGERGCGIAAAIILAKRLSQNVTVDLVLTNGHELGFIGGISAAKKYSATADWVLHLGSCIANRDSRLTCISSAAPDIIKAIATSLEPLDAGRVIPVDIGQQDNWLGESICWAAYGIPMLSIAGIAPNFHTANDLPETATTPELLADAIDSIYRATLTLINPGK
ncbi:MAG: Zn-dependent exopeptidase M28 [Hyphomicrobiales bacterium]|nr:Zn-dependent exopeptidase M28 [Hyphomicrobiales bacterium]